MDTDNLKQLWQRMDEAIGKQQVMNTELIRQIVSTRNRRSLNSMSRIEYLGIGVAVIVLMAFFVFLPRLGNTPLLIVCYIISVLIMLTTVVTGLYKSKYLSSVDYSAQNVTDVSEKIERFRLFIAREKIVALAIGPVIIASFIAVVFKMVHDINIFNNIVAYLPRIIAGSAAYIILAIMLYNYFYFRNIQEIRSNLTEIRELKSK